jgi:hypothetical protein
MSAWASAYSLSFLKENNIEFVYEREILNEDYFFNFQALLYSKKIEILHSVLYMYEYRYGSLSKRYNPDMLRGKENLLEQYKVNLNKMGLFENYKISYYKQCIDSYYACITNECSKWNKKGFREESNAVRLILESKRCKEAFNYVDCKKMSTKGKIIYFLMKHKYSKLICTLYKAIKG